MTLTAPAMAWRASDLKLFLRSVWQAVVIPGTSGNLSFLSTSLLIVAGVVIDTMRQLEAQLMMRNYQGFMK